MFIALKVEYNWEVICMNCPHCKRIDMVQKVSAIVSAGITESQSGTVTIGRVSGDHDSGTYIGGSYSTGVSVTNLVQRLSPPEEPTPPASFARLKIFLMIIGVILFLDWFFEFLSAGFDYFWVKVKYFGEKEMQYQTSYEEFRLRDAPTGRGSRNHEVFLADLNFSSATRRFTEGLAQGLFVIFGIAYFLHKRQQELPAKRDQYMRDHEEWVRLMNYWDTQYYCHRCDKTFIFNNGH